MALGWPFVWGITPAKRRFVCSEEKDRPTLSGWIRHKRPTKSRPILSVEVKPRVRIRGPNHAVIIGGLYGETQSLTNGIWSIGKYSVTESHRVGIADACLTFFQVFSLALFIFSWSHCTTLSDSSGTFRGDVSNPLKGQCAKIESANRPRIKCKKPKSLKARGKLWISRTDPIMIQWLAPS